MVPCYVFLGQKCCPSITRHLGKEGPPLPGLQGVTGKAGVALWFWGCSCAPLRTISQKAVEFGACCAVVSLRPCSEGIFPSRSPYHPQHSFYGLEKGDALEIHICNFRFVPTPRCGLAPWKPVGVKAMNIFCAFRRHSF